MMRKVFALFVCCVMTSGVAYAQEDSTHKKVIWSQQIDVNQPWGSWMVEVYRPYSDEMSRAILKIASSAAHVDPTGKSSEELLAEVNAALNDSLKSMEQIKPPLELKEYHEKIIEMYRQAINADPKEEEQSKIIQKQLSIEADQAMEKAFKLHGVPEKVIYSILHD